MPLELCRVATEEGRQAKGDIRAAQYIQNIQVRAQFGNVAIEYGRNDLRRFTKGGPAASHKHDNLSALADAVYCFDITEGRIEG